MKRSLLLPLLLLSISMQAGYFTDQNSRPLCPGDAGLLLHNKYLYYFTGAELSIVAEQAGESALRLGRHDTVFLYVAAGQKLFLRGANGSGRIGGGAGIEVPDSSVLYILGSGLVDVKGGDAGLGSIGGDGEKGSFSDHWLSTSTYKGGNGGYGGDGGGGAGAGIGGRGGEGGQGAPSSVGPEMEQTTKNNGADGTPGIKGGNSQSGHNCGTVYLIGDLTVTVTPGQSSTKTNFSSLGRMSERKRGGALGHDFIAGGGGGGGNGNNGLEATMIGGGGAGAAGGGSGSSGGIANAYTLDAGSLLKAGLQFITSKVINAIYVAITKDPTAGEIIVINLPINGGYKFPAATVGSLIARGLFKFINIDMFPLQINGGGGQGSGSGYCRAQQIDGFGFYIPTFEYKNILGEKTTRNCPEGGKMGEFGQTGTLKEAKKSWLTKVSQTMPIFQPGTYPKELQQALTFTLSFDTTGIDMSKPHPTNRDIVYSDTLPQVVPVPTHREPGKVFMGYSDELGNYWYNRLGQALPTVRDTLGQALKLYVHPGDMMLVARWASYNYVIVRHWQQSPAVTFALNDNEYDLAEYEMVPYLGHGWYVTNAHYYPHFMADKAIDSVNVQDSVAFLDFYYTREEFALSWDVPTYANILSTNYTLPGNIRFASKIRAPQYAQDKTSGGYYELTGWKQGATSVTIDTMPAAATVFTPTMKKIQAAISYQNDALKGVVTKADTWLGTNIRFRVAPAAGWELDTCYATYFSKGMSPETKPIDRSDNDLVMSGAPTHDSIAVRINYRGVNRGISYTESKGRYGTMTLYVNGDSLTNDGGLNMTHTVRHGDVVWISPQASPDGNYHVEDLTVVTKAGAVVPTTLIEDYNARNQYRRYYQFVMPNEDVNAVADYYDLASHQVNLRVRSSNALHVYSNRGELLDASFLYSEGYLVEAGELIWIEAMVDTTRVLDSVQVSYTVDGNPIVYESMERKLFVENTHNVDLLNDTIIEGNPVAYVRYCYRMPYIANYLLIEFKYANTDFLFESETGNDLEEVEQSSAMRRGIYNIMGVYMGEDLDRLPAGLYIVNGKKVLKGYSNNSPF